MTLGIWPRAPLGAASDYLEGLALRTSSRYLHQLLKDTATGILRVLRPSRVCGLTQACALRDVRQPPSSRRVP
jgi:hypothetical protein